MKRILILGLVIFYSVNFYGQKSVNDYKYVIVPDEYGFLKGKDKYQLNSLSKFLFNKYGFTAFLQSEEKPKDMLNNGCLALTTDVKKESGMFLTKLIVELKNCSGAIVFTSSAGQSREKEFKKAYHEALREAFKDVQKLNYKYSEVHKAPEVTSVSPTEVVKNDIKEAKPSKKPVVAKTEASVSKTSSYIFNDVYYTFQKKEYGYELLEKRGSQLISIGKVYKSNQGNNYIVKAGELSGNGYFDSYGNFTLERINPVTDKLITDTFARQ